MKSTIYNIVLSIVRKYITEHSTRPETHEGEIRMYTGRIFDAVKHAPNTNCKDYAVKFMSENYEDSPRMEIAIKRLESCIGLLSDQNQPKILEELKDSLSKLKKATGFNYQNAPTAKTVNQQQLPLR